MRPCNCNATRFACGQARIHRSISGCDKCTWWQPPELVTDEELLRAYSGGVVAPRHASRATRPPFTTSTRTTTIQQDTRPTTSWWTCVNKPPASVSHLRARNSKFIDIVQVAIMSAKLHAPSLSPYVLYMHGPEQEYDEVGDELLEWMRAQGVRVVNSRLTFAEHIPRIRWRMRTLTGVCKLDIPRAAHALAPELAARQLDTERVLWTDADILFAGDWDMPRLHALPTFAAGTEFFSSSLNSGVIYGNVSTMVREWPRMLQFAIRKRFKFQVADQSWMQQFFGKRWTVLDDALYNARPFAHPQRSRVVGVEGGLAGFAPLKSPRIWHWHGYKASDVHCWLSAMANGTWPERAWRPLDCERGSCTYKPIRGSGCRYLGRISPSPCYLRTYTYLLRQADRLLELARRSHPVISKMSGQAVAVRSNSSFKVPLWCSP
jgi:hypothetical protein